MECGFLWELHGNDMETFRFILFHLRFVNAGGPSNWDVARLRITAEMIWK
jgi:hypothetical protein